MSQEAIHRMLKFLNFTRIQLGLCHRVKNPRRKSRPTVISRSECLSTINFDKGFDAGCLAVLRIGSSKLAITTSRAKFGAMQSYSIT